MRKWTQSDLAKRCGVSISFIGLIERGVRKPSLETMVSVCKELNVSMDSVLLTGVRNEIVGFSKKDWANAESILRVALDIAKEEARNQ